MKRLAWLLLLGACSFNRPDSAAPVDAITDSPPPLPDAGPCTAATVECFTNDDTEVLRTCGAAGEEPVLQTCPWGCLGGADPHCGVLQPAGGAVRPEDLEELATLLPITIDDDDTVWNADTGEITGVFTRPPGTGVQNGIEWIDRNDVGIFRLRSLTLNGEIEPVGVRAIAIVALETITVNDDIDMVQCGQNEQPAGGFLGGASGNNPGPGLPALMGGGGPGDGTDNNDSGGGGGGHAGGGGQGGGGAGGSATPRSVGGDIRGDEEISKLIGGAGGGGGRAANGGKGGGAIQLVANGAIVFSDKGRLNAGGCGGQSGQDNKSAGGGGAGGTILIEAPTITLDEDSVLAANGGAGGGGDEDGGNGQPGQPSAVAATGGPGANNGGKGGNGAAGTELNGEDGTSAQNGGGGGGGIGRILLKTLSGMVTGSATATISPTPGAGSPTKIVPAAVQ